MTCDDDLGEVLYHALIGRAMVVVGVLPSGSGEHLVTAMNPWKRPCQAPFGRPASSLTHDRCPGRYSGRTTPWMSGSTAPGAASAPTQRVGATQNRPSAPPAGSESTLPVRPEEHFTH